MEPIKLICIETKAIDDDLGPDELVTKFDYVYDYDEDDNEEIVGLKILDSSQYSQEEADRDWKQVLGYIEEDQHRVDTYGYTWYSMGIQAIATLHFPERTTKSSIIQTIESPGLFGIESDSEESYIRDEEEYQISILLDMLEQMNVEVPDTFKCKLTISESEVLVGDIKKMYR